MYVEKLVINTGKLIKSGLSIEAYFTLVCLSHDYQEVIELYVDKISRIDKSVFKALIDAGWVEIIGESITFDNIKITNKTDKFFNIVTTTLDHKKFFQELRDTYPKSAKFRGKRRPLHSDMDACEKKYRAIIDSEELHKKIIKCVKMYTNDLMKKDGSLEFMQLLSTWINQKNYQSYIDDTDDFKESEETNTYDAV